MQFKSFISLWPICSIFILFVTAVLFRPLLPVDETRYMSVAWEMYQNHGWLHPLTMNFEPYHQKPPLLFWLINAAWGIFGVSRWASLIPIALSSLASLYLTGVLGRQLFPAMPKHDPRLYLIIIGCVPFLIYSTLIMFDLTLAIFVLLALINTIAYANHRRFRYLVIIGLSLGLGVLTKGPVAYLYGLFPFLFAPYWAHDIKDRKYWYLSCMITVLISFIPILLWLIPVLIQSNQNFALWLVWNQTAGRITGNFGGAHSRPLYFYLPLLPVMVMPWIFIPTFWKGLYNAKEKMRQNNGMRFLACFLIPVFISFSLISGKQPHYLVPLLPGFTLITWSLLDQVQTKTLATIMGMMVVLIVGGQWIASKTVFTSYDLAPIADYIRIHSTYDIAYAGTYNAEIGFLARLKRPVTAISLTDLSSWFATHPHGLAVVAYKDDHQVMSYTKLLHIVYHDEKLGIFACEQTKTASNPSSAGDTRF